MRNPIIIQVIVISALVTIANCYYSNGASAFNNNNYNNHVNQEHEEYVPVITSQGVPEETPEVKAAKAEHFALFAKAEGLHRSGKTNEIQYWKPTVDQSSKSYYSSPIIKGTGYGWNNLPRDTAEVAAAKAAHLQALHKAQSLELSNYGQLDDGEWHGEEYYSKKNNNGNNGIYNSNQYSFSSSHEPVAQIVQQAELAHFNTLGHVQQTPHFNHQQQQHHHRYKRGIFSHPHYSNHYNNEHVPVITQDGVPLDTPAVQQARQEHILLAHAKNYGSNLYSGWSAVKNNYYNSQDIQASSINYKITHDTSYRKYRGPEYLPVIKNGVPVDTPEVQLAKQQHLLAVNQAKSGAFVGPVDTPEVQLAKAQHFRALAQEKAKHYQGGYSGHQSFGYSNQVHH